MSRFRQGGKPSRPVIVTSRKKQKTERRIANEYGVQKRVAVQVALERAEKLEQEFRSRVQEGEPLTEVQADMVKAVAGKALGVPYEWNPVKEAAREAGIDQDSEEAEDPLGEDQPAYPVTTDWAAEEGNWYSKESGWKCAIFRLKNGSREVLNCPHKHKTPDTARGCALREAMGRNKHADWSDSVWKPDARYPWTDEGIKALIDEVRAE